MCPDLLAPIERDKIEASDRALRARARIAENSVPPTLAQVFDLQGADGCGNCGHWKQRSRTSVIGDCGLKKWLTCFAGRCSDHLPKGARYG
jgi:hypothetical protein